MNALKDYWTRVGLRLEAFFARNATLRYIYSLAHGMSRDDVAVHASAMTFDIFLSLIPMFALAGWLLGLLLSNNPEALGYVSQLLDVTPFQVHQVIQAQLSRFSELAPLVLLGSLYIASGAFHTAMNVFEHATNARRRTWWLKRALSLACVIAAILALGLSGVVGVLLSGGPTRTVLALLGPNTIPGLARVVTYGVAFVVATIFLAGFFRIAVHHPARKRHVWPGALLTVTIGSVVSWGFAEYLRTLARYTLYYGSLATVAVTLVWLYLWCLALLVGVELNAQLENEERRRLPRASVPPPRLPSSQPPPPLF